MFRRLCWRIAFSSVLSLAIAGAVAAASPAQAAQVGPGQYFTGQVFGATAQSVIEVACAGPASTGHPVAGQTVEVAELLPPVSTQAGYTGDQAVEIDTTLIYSTGPALVQVPIATFTQYFLKLPIPTSITVPCGGTGVMNFSPYPLDSGTPSKVSVKFQSLGV
jgi:hypothetical protein